MNTYIKPFSQIRITDVPYVGGKNASLGEMYNQLISKGVQVPNGFATTAEAFWAYLDENSLRDPLIKLLSELDINRYSNLDTIGKKARNLILGENSRSNFPKKSSKPIMTYVVRNPAQSLCEVVPQPRTFPMLVLQANMTRF